MSPTPASPAEAARAWADKSAAICVLHPTLRAIAIEQVTALLEAREAELLEVMAAADALADVLAAVTGPHQRIPFGKTTQRPCDCNACETLSAYRVIRKLVDEPEPTPRTHQASVLDSRKTSVADPSQGGSNEVD